MTMHTCDEFLLYVSACNVDYIHAVINVVNNSGMTYNLLSTYLNCRYKVKYACPRLYWNGFLWHIYQSKQLYQFFRICLIVTKLQRRHDHILKISYFMLVTAMLIRPRSNEGQPMGRRQVPCPYSKLSDQLGLAWCKFSFLVIVCNVYGS